MIIRKYTKTLCRCALSLLLSLLLCGCGMFSFETPEEQRAAAEAAQKKRQEMEETVDVKALLTDEFYFSRDLTNSLGCALANYSVRLPEFSCDGQRPESFERINHYFENEFAGLKEGCDGFFADVQTLLGEGWNELEDLPPDDFAQVSVEYALLDAPDGYVSIRCDYVLSENRQKDQWSQGFVFLLDNGWELTMETLLGSDYDTAAPLLLESILSWCTENEVEVSTPESLTFSDFSQGYLLTEDALIFYTQPFQLSNEDGTRYAISLPLADYVQYFNS